LLPESARFLIEMGRLQEAKQMLARYGSVITTRGVEAKSEKLTAARHESSTLAILRPQLGLALALTLAALVWGLVNFGILLWLPGSLVAAGRSVSLASSLIARSALFAIPTIAITTYLYTVWSTKRVLVLAIGIMTLGLLATLFGANRMPRGLGSPIVSVSLMVIGTSAVISILLPYTSESFPVRLRGRTTGWVAGCSKIGGVTAQALALMKLVPAFAIAAGAVAVPTVGALLLVAIFGHETRGLDLRELETPSRKELAHPEAALQDQ
jgi:MFS transporter, putative metabolite:H+ symporter